MPTHSCPTLCDPMNCRLPGSSVHEIFQARILEWVAISYSIYMCVCVCVCVCITTNINQWIEKSSYILNLLNLE